MRGRKAVCAWSLYRWISTVTAIVLVATVCGCAMSSWEDELVREILLLGHRNWIVVADAAYPAQSSGGIETVVTGTGQLEVVDAVLDAVDRAPHIRAIVHLDAELGSVSEDDAPGIAEYRQALQELLAGRLVNKVLHEELIGRLDEAAETFRVLILKTDMTLPYTSVFLLLDCGYWSAEAEQRLRDAIKP